MDSHPGVIRFVTRLRYEVSQKSEVNLLQFRAELLGLNVLTDIALALRQKRPAPATLVGTIGSLRNSKLAIHSLTSQRGRIVVLPSTPVLRQGDAWASVTEFLLLSTGYHATRMFLVTLEKTERTLGRTQGQVVENQLRLRRYKDGDPIFR